MAKFLRGGHIYFEFVGIFDFVYCVLGVVLGSVLLEATGEVVAKREKPWHSA